MFFIAYTFKGQVHVFAGRVNIVSHPSCRTSAILKKFCPKGMSGLIWVQTVCKGHQQTTFVVIRKCIQVLPWYNSSQSKALRNYFELSKVQQCHQHTCTCSICLYNITSATRGQISLSWCSLFNVLPMVLDPFTFRKSHSKLSVHTSQMHSLTLSLLGAHAN